MRSVLVSSLPGTRPTPAGGRVASSRTGLRLRAAGALLLALVVGAGVPAARAGSGSFTLFHTNDLHAHFLPEPATWRDDKALIGGFEALESTLRRERESAGPSLYLDAGDFMTGTPLSDLEYKGAKGGAVVEFYNQLGLDAMSIGNHEFDLPLSNLDSLVALADFPILAANLRYTGGQPVFEKDFVTFEVGGVRVGVIGITTDKLDELISPKKRQELEISSGVAALDRLVPEVDPMTDLIIVLSHEGIETDREIARQVAGIDIIVGGHSHTRLDHGERVNGVLILQAGSSGRYLGRVDLEVENDRLKSADSRLIPTWAEGAKASPEIEEMVRTFGKQIDEEFGKVIAQAPAPLGRCYFCESELGDWLTDQMRQIAGTDVALLNSGGIRKDLAAGPVKKLDVQEILPFANLLCRFSCTGAQLAAIARHNAAAEATEDHGILQVSGLEYSWSPAPDGADLSVVLVGGQPVDPEARYTVATVDFIAQSQPEKYLGFVPDNVDMLGSALAPVIMEAAARLGTIETPRSDRIRKVETAPVPAATGGE